VSEGFGATFLEAIAAAWLLVTAVYASISADDVSGKILGTYLFHLVLFVGKMMLVALI
jgi:formate/nitrite transporter FocA (FNT family)